MVITTDSLLIKQLEKLLNVILVFSIVTWQDERWNYFYFADSVTLIHIATEIIWSDELLKVLPSAASYLPVGEHFTRSRSTHIPPWTWRQPRRVSTGVKYGETPSAAETPDPIKAKLAAAKPNRSGPTPGWISSHNKSSVALLVWLPPIKTEAADVPNKDEPPPQVEDNADSNDSLEDDIPLAEIAKKLCGTFTTRQHVLAKKTEPCKYRCRMCKEQLPSCKALTVHHQTKHGVIYCDVCGKALKNPHALTKHMYQHKDKKHVCNKCGKSFPFMSQLTTHKLTHRKRPNQSLCTQIVVDVLKVKVT